METRRWFKWEPGLFPELERMPLEEVGMFLLIGQDYWRTGEKHDANAHANRFCIPFASILHKLLPRLYEYLDGIRLSDLSQKRSNAAKSRWEKTRMQLHSKDYASALQVASQIQIQNQNQIQSQNIPPTPPKKRGVPSGFTMDDIQFIDEVWINYPNRFDSGGERQTKGNKAKAMARIKDAMSRHHLTREDVLAIQADYAKSPNVQKGFIQLVETFWGESGHWFGCWTNVVHERSKAQ